MTGHAFRQDLRSAARTLGRAPGFSAVVIATLALGIGANTAIFSVVNALLLRTLPVSAPERLMLVTGPGSGPGAALWSLGTWEQLNLRAGAFDGAFTWVTPEFTLRDRGGEQRVPGLVTSGEFFNVLGVRPVIGRMYTAADDVRGGGPDGPVAVISHALWQRHFGGAADVVGKPLVLQKVPFTIVGVAPSDFFGVEVGRSFDVAVPLGAHALIRGPRHPMDVPSNRGNPIVLRLRAGQSIESATRTLRELQPAIAEAAAPADFPQLRDSFLKEPFVLAPIDRGISPLRQRFGQPLLTLFAIVALVLLIACANIANLLLARATARGHEASVRLTLGAAPWQLARLLLIESALLAALGALAGLLLAGWGSRALVAQFSPSGVRAGGADGGVLLDLSFDWRVLAFTAGIAAATALASSGVPAWRATRRSAGEMLNARGAATRSSRGLSSGLVMAQVALSLILVIAAGLLVRTFERLGTAWLGFDRGVLLVSVDTGRAALDAATRPAFYHQLAATVAGVPGIAHAAGSLITPLSGSSFGMGASVGGRPFADTRINFVTPGWFAAYGMPLRAGRDISGQDTAGSQGVMVVNEAFVRRLDLGDRAIGQSVACALGPKAEIALGPRTIVGVVGDAAYLSVREDPPPTAYLPIAQWPNVGIPIMPTLHLGIRAARGSAAAATPAVTAALSEVDRNLTFNVRPLEEQISRTFVQERLVAALAGLFGTVALLLASIGLYGVTWYGVTRRRSEIGVRMALGATRSDVLKLVLGRSTRVTLAGIALGLAGAAVATRALEKMLFGLSPLDPVTFGGVTLLFLIVTTLAAALPARRAARVDPVVTLRYE